jgi:hypothetical protein
MLMLILLLLLLYMQVTTSMRVRTVRWQTPVML